MTAKPMNGSARMILWAAGAVLGLVVALMGITSAHVNKTVQPLEATVARQQTELDHQHEQVVDITDRLARIETKLDMLLADR